jgi:gas vesicle protein
MNIKDRFFDVIPLKRRSAADWIVPSVLGLGVGFVAGVGVGLLYAPETGEEVRLRLREGAFRVKERAASLAERAKEQVASKAEQLQHS